MGITQWMNVPDLIHHPREADGVSTKRGGRRLAHHLIHHPREADGVGSNARTRRQLTIVDEPHRVVVEQLIVLGLFVNGLDLGKS